MPRTKLVEYEFGGIKYLRKVDKDGKVLQEGIEPDGWKPMEYGRNNVSSPLLPASRDQKRMIKDFIFDGLERDPFKCVFRLNNRNDRKPREVPFTELTKGDCWDILNAHRKHNLSGLKKLIVEKEKVNKCSVCQQEVKPPLQWWSEPYNACSDCVKKAALELQAQNRAKKEII